MVGDYDRLQTDLEFATESYHAARAAYDAAVAEARRQGRYLAAHVTPTRAESARFPQRETILATVTLFLILSWTTVVLVVYALKDRAMIHLEGLTKTFRLRGPAHPVIDRVTLDLPPRRSVALLGRNGAGKSTLLRLIAGTMAPTAGRVRMAGSVSWPVGFAGSFHGDLSGAQNTRFIARIYGVDSDDLVEFARDFAEIGSAFHLPFRTYSSGMKARLAFGVSMGIAFDTYLVDEVTAVGDAAFRAKSAALFRARMASAGAIVVSHAMGQLRELCDAAMLIDRGRVLWFDDLGEAITRHEALLRA